MKLISATANQHKYKEMQQILSGKIELLPRPPEIPEIIAKAFYIARSGRPGPVLIDITKDAQFDTLDFSYQKCSSVRSYKAIPEIEMDQVEAAAALINQAKNPLIVFGQGVILGEAESEFKTFVEKTRKN